MNGKVFLVGAGPGDPELLTIKALRTLQSADAVLHDDLVSPEILALIPASAEVRNVGKRCGRKNITQEEINALLVAFASFGLKVVRLKSGDPLIFGRAGEEMQALRKAGIDFEVVPGVTSALASAAAARISLTHRESASAVLFVTGHHAKATKNVEWRRYVASAATLAIYMPGSDYQQISEQLIVAGLEAETACAIVSRASSPTQQIHRTTLKNLKGSPSLPAPTLLLVGEALSAADVVPSGLDAALGMLQSVHPNSLPSVPHFSNNDQVFLGD
jgi:uroporphyrin-III C-methyltransferase